MPRGTVVALAMALLQGAVPSAGGEPPAVAASDLLDDYSLRQWTIEDGLPERRVVDVSQAADGYLWVATSRHLLRFDGFRFVDAGSPGDDFDANPVETIRRVVGGGDGAVAVATSAGWRRYHGANGWSRLEQAAAEEASRRAPATPTMVDTSGAEWTGDENGIRVHLDGHWAALETGKAPVNVSTTALLEDREGNVWAGTDAGLIRLRRRTKGVRVLRTGDQAAGVRAAWIAADGSIWATAEQGGVVRFAGDAKGGGAEPVSFAGDAGGLRFESILVSADGEIWLGTDGASLWHGRPGAALERIPETADGRRVRVIPKLAGDPARRLWIGSGAGLFILDAGDPVPRPLPTAGGDEGVVEDILPEADGTLWIGRQDSWLQHVDHDGAMLQSFRRPGLPRGSIWSLHRDRSGGLWAGGDGRLIRLSDENPSVFDASNGLPDVAITQIEDTASGVLWLGTRDGLFACDLSRLDRPGAMRQRFLFRRFDPDGPLAHVACTGRINKPSEPGGPLAGGACFPTSIGVVTLDPDVTLTRPTPPLAVLERVTVTSRDGITTTATTPATVTVPADASLVSVRYTAIHLAAPEAVRFRYRLSPAALPVDAASSLDEWTIVGRDRHVVLRSLPSGRHRFEVRAGIDGKYADQSAAVILDVDSLFWQRPAFVAASGLMAAAAVAATSAGVLRHRYRRKLARTLALQRERERIARDIHDDLGAGLTHVAHLSAMAVDHHGEGAASRAIFQRIFAATTGLAQSLDEIVWAVNPANDTLDKLISYLAEFAQEFTAAAGVACRLDLPDELPERPVPSHVRHHVCMLLKESLHNAVTHGRPAEILVALTVQSGSLLLTVRDDGRGFDRAAMQGGESGRRSGLAAMQQRVEELDGRLAIESAPDAGTTVRIEIEV